MNAFYHPGNPPSPLPDSNSTSCPPYPYPLFPCFDIQPSFFLFLCTLFPFFSTPQCSLPKEASSSAVLSISPPSFLLETFPLRLISAAFFCAPKGSFHVVVAPYLFLELAKIQFFRRFFVARDFPPHNKKPIPYQSLISSSFFEHFL